MFLCGEYAVLAGAPAIVAAVRPLATARWSSDDAGEASLPRRVARRLAERMGLRLPPGGPAVDTAAFLGPDGTKLGLGSSAAAAAAAAGAAAEALGVDPEAPEVRPFLLGAALAAHREHQGGVGSGADVAASVMGGILGFDAAAGAQPVAQPQDLRWAVVRVGPGGAPTADMVRRVMATGPPARGAAMAELSVVAVQAAEAWVAGRALPFLECVRAYGDGLSRLGDAAGVPIVTPRDRLVAEIARRHGGAAKPSGAGGGELAVVFAESDEALAATLADCAAAGAPRAAGVAAEAEGVRTLPLPSP